MGFLDFLKKVRPVEEHRIAEVYFLCEQDGVPERDLKRVLIGVFRRYPDIKRAYLVRVQYGRGDAMDVALCLEANVASKTPVAEVSRKFAALFGKDQHLDILYLSPPQSKDITRVANPFYVGTHEPAQSENKNGHS
jgi:hypothetical protein